MRLLSPAVAAALFVLGAPALAQVDDAAHKKCLEARDYAGCVKTLGIQHSPSQKKSSKKATEIVDGSQKIFGVSLVKLTKESFRECDSSGEWYVGQVFEGSSAAKAGLKLGQKVQAINGESVDDLLAEWKNRFPYRAMGNMKKHLNSRGKISLAVLSPRSSSAPIDLQIISELYPDSLLESEVDNTTKNYGSEYLEKAIAEIWGSPEVMELCRRLPLHPAYTLAEEKGFKKARSNAFGDIPKGMRIGGSYNRSGSCPSGTSMVTIDKRWNFLFIRGGKVQEIGCMSPQQFARFNAQIELDNRAASSQIWRDAANNMAADRRNQQLIDAVNQPVYCNTNSTTTGSINSYGGTGYSSINGSTYGSTTCY